MVSRLIAKLHAGQVLLVMLALAIFSATAVRPTGLLEVRVHDHGPRLLASLAVDLLPIGHEYRAAPTPAQPSAPIVLTERFVLAAPSHVENTLALLQTGWSLHPTARGKVSAAIYTAISPRSPPLA
jgi:hypothetical protein